MRSTKSDHLRQLSAPQRRFASEHRAIPEVRPNSHEESVYVYRDEGWRTFRWLVSPSGKVTDFTSLHYSVAGS
ncbi:MAG: hypothetical protein KGJ43_03490 [Acidobacteriota bacterium]|nr:hypothetical protein [Acidobacteriota bacterium]